MSSLSDELRRKMKMKVLVLSSQKNQNSLPVFSKKETEHTAIWQATSQLSNTV
jgi:hypothetical protein